MNTREILWAGADCDLRYAVAGNLNLAAGSKGTISFWTDHLYPWAWGYAPDEKWFSFGAGAEEVRFYRSSTNMYWRCRDKTTCYVAVNGLTDYVAMHHFVLTWDFSGGAGAGKLRVYLDGTVSPNVCDDATASASTATAWYLGGDGQVGYGARGRFDNWAIWNDVMTPAQVAALYAKDRHYMPVQGDGTGALTFLADFNGAYDARIAGGSKTATYTAGKVARLYEAGVNPDQRLLLRLGNLVDANDIAQGWAEDVPGRVPALAAFCRERGTATATDQPGYAQFTLKKGEWGRWVCPFAPWGRLGPGSGTAPPHRVRARFHISGLGTGKVRLGGSGTEIQVYADKLVDASGNTLKLSVQETLAGQYAFVDFAYISPHQGAGANGFLMANNAQVAIGAQYSPFDWGVYLEGKDATDYDGWTGDLTVRVESIEIGGAPFVEAAYQRTEALRDEFSMLGRIWRKENVTRTLAKPTVCASNPVFRLSGITSWNPTELWYQNVQVVGDQLRMLVCSQAAGNARMGFLWSTDGIAWTEDARNPICDLGQFQRGFGEKMGWRGEVRAIGIVQDDDAKHWLVLTGEESGAPDHWITCLVGPANDPYSFDYTMLFKGNPVARASGQRFDDFTQWPQLFPNRDLSLHIIRDPYARHPWQRYRGYARGKHIAKGQGEGGTEYRPWVAMQSGDLFTWRGQHPATPPYPLYHYGHEGNVQALGRDLYVHFVEEGSASESDGTRLVSEGSGPAGRPVEAFIDLGVGVRYYAGAGFATLAGTTYYFMQVNSNLYLWTMREDGEAYYSLQAGQVSGRVQTCALKKPTTGWGKLWVNAVNVSGPRLSVAVLHPDTEVAIAGYDFGDCDPFADGTRVEVTWGGKDLSALTGDYYALKFEFGRSLPGDPTPAVYAYVLEPPVRLKPVVGNLTAEGQVNPAHVVDPTPEFAWSYSHPLGEPQVAYQLLVSSTLEKLDDEQGDVWDSGEVASSAPSCTYAGPSLAEYSVYYWKVRAQSSGGMWSDW